MMTTDTPTNAHKDIPGNPSTSKSSKHRLNDLSNGAPLRVLSETDWNFWKENGYIVVKRTIPGEQADNTAGLLWEFEEKDPLDSSTWYAPPRAEMKMKELAGTGMVEIYNHQHLWTNRSSQRIYDSFVDIWGTKALWVTIDRANLNFPIKDGKGSKGFIHWDYDPETKPQNVQGLIALCDQQDYQMGGFQCIPWLYRNYDTWKLNQPTDRDRFKPDISLIEKELVKVPLEKGDLLIFNSLLPHGIRPNLSQDKVRIAQYISMMPAEEENNTLKAWRINSWKNRIAPEGFAFPGDPRNWELTKYETAQLTPLGEKLLGLETWSEEDINLSASMDPGDPYENLFPNP
ncbi:MAG: hypothetical protein ACJA01_002368 [Saprospiraceae bacterium]|jgi:hypothetical protein